MKEKGEGKREKGKGKREKGKGKREKGKRKGKFYVQVTKNAWKQFLLFCNLLCWQKLRLINN